MLYEHYDWPKPITFYPDQGQKSYRLKRLRFHLRSLLYKRVIRQFVYFVQQNPQIQPLLAHKPSYYYPLVHRFLDKRFHAEQRLKYMCQSLQFLPQKLRELGLPPLWENPISFGEIVPNLALRLNINEFQAMEGFWALELYDISIEQCVYVLTFANVDDAFLIGSIQGPNFDGSKELVKKLTKACHGLRPAYLLIESMKALTMTLNVKQLLGIPHQYQNKSRVIQSKRYVVNYDEMFKESAGVKHKYWELPTYFNIKDIETIASNKRSMYRKRYAMLTDIQQRMMMLMNKQAQ
ncbi:VirK/YbjX family protein [Conservatibacter flavescens]|uniref:DUF535 domain-containing protein n=1 Tax=Conservatibacter flavescens TaxID=28161 RepID=A0A2M8S0Q9_9PAST|nr:VirK/YbjX family protein [Conservatibacter flavescens]PJG84715.1 DUF535 domain-containing protein [Conservatibacter flavescens]